MIYRQYNKVVIKDGAVAVSADCCCPCACFSVSYAEGLWSLAWSCMDALEDATFSVSYATSQERVGCTCEEHATSFSAGTDTSIELDDTDVPPEEGMWYCWTLKVVQGETTTALCCVFGRINGCAGCEGGDDIDVNLTLLSPCAGAGLIGHPENTGSDCEPACSALTVTCPGGGTCADGSGCSPGAPNSCPAGCVACDIATITIDFDVTCDTDDHGTWEMTIQNPVSSSEATITGSGKSGSVDVEVKCTCGCNTGGGSCGGLPGFDVALVAVQWRADDGTLCASGGGTIDLEAFSLYCTPTP